MYDHVDRSICINFKENNIYFLMNFCAVHWSIGTTTMDNWQTYHIDEVDELLNYNSGQLQAITPKKLFRLELKLIQGHHLGRSKSSLFRI